VGIANFIFNRMYKANTAILVAAIKLALKHDHHVPENIVDSEYVTDAVLAAAMRGMEQKRTARRVVTTQEIVDFSVPILIQLINKEFGTQHV